MEYLKEALSPPPDRPLAQVDKISLVQNWRQDQEDTTYDVVDFATQDHKTQSFEDPGHHASPRKEDDDEDDEDDLANHYSLYGRLVVEAPAYQWLLASLKREYQLTLAEPNVMEAIKQEIIRYLPPSRRINRNRSAEAYRITFQVHWDPMTFIHEQGYAGDPQLILETAVTITGSTRDAQAQTCVEYLSQTWPHTGKYIIELIKTVMDKREQLHSRK